MEKTIPQRLNELNVGDMVLNDQGEVRRVLAALKEKGEPVFLMSGNSNLRVAGPWYTLSELYLYNFKPVVIEKKEEEEEDIPHDCVLKDQSWMKHSWGKWYAVGEGGIYCQEHICVRCGKTERVNLPPTQFPDYFEPIEERWEPEKGERYYFITDHIDIAVGFWGENIYPDTQRFNHNNIFKTYTQAKEVVERVGEILLDYQKEIHEK